MDIRFIFLFLIITDFAFAQSHIGIKKREGWDATNNWQSVEEYSENNTVSKVRGITPIVVLAMHLSTKKRFRVASQPIATERFGLIMTELLKKC